MHALNDTMQYVRQLACTLDHNIFICITHYRHQLDIVSGGSQSSIWQKLMGINDLLGNCKYLHNRIPILVHSEHCFKTINFIHPDLVIIYAFDSEYNCLYTWISWFREIIILLLKKSKGTCAPSGYPQTTPMQLITIIHIYNPGYLTESL